jgi:hypothetical protein
VALYSFFFEILVGVFFREVTSISITNNVPKKLVQLIEKYINYNLKNVNKLSIIHLKNIFKIYLKYVKNKPLFHSILKNILLPQVLFKIYKE